MAISQKTGKLCDYVNWFISPNDLYVLHLWVQCLAISVQIHDSISCLGWNHCQAQPQPQLQLDWAEIALLSLLWGTTIHLPYTIHPTGIVVFQNVNLWHLHRLFINLFMTSKCEFVASFRWSEFKLVWSLDKLDWAWHSSAPLVFPFKYYGNGQA